MEARKHITWIDYTKGLGIFLVVLCHAIQLSNSQSGFELAFNRWIYAFHMPLFFVLAGLGMGLRKGVHESGFKNICSHLLKPFYLWSIIYIVLGTCANLVHHRTGIIKNLGERTYATVTGRGIAPMWFLFNLAIVEIIFIASMRWLHNLMSERNCLPRYSEKKIGEGWFVISIIVAELFFTLIKGQNEINTIAEYPLISIARVFLAMAFLASGFLLGQHYEWFMKHRKWILLISAGIFIICQGFTNNNVNMHLFDFDSLAFFIVTGLSGSAAFFVICSWLPGQLRWLEYLGKNSMGIMILHYPPIPILKGFLVMLSVLRIVGITLWSTILTILVISVLLRLYEMHFGAGPLEENKF